MLFNSYAFLLGFLPLSLVIHGLVELYRPAWRLPVLLALSFAFYSYWDWRFMPLLAASIVVNWMVAEAFIGSRRAVLISVAIVANLIVLSVFKYANFAAGLVGLIPGLTTPTFDIALPLGISFFTFHHVMYLVDLRAGKAPRLDLMRYALYIAFFPQVLAGPLVRWSELVHQLDERPYARPDAAERFARGLMLLVIGLAKKAFLGDPLSLYVNPIYEAAASGQDVSFLQAWQATLGFGLQVYFDFSGYTDMALGIALMFGVVLPQNFDAPYAATSLEDMWRRWHMTLSRFLRDYLYIPLGGSKFGLPVQLWALFATMTLGGLWHGAGMNFVVWGALQGVGLVVCVLWRKAGLRLPSLLGWALTIGYFSITLVIFRAGTFEVTAQVFEGLVGLSSLGDWREFKWRTIALALGLACIGPTSWVVIHRLPARPWVALGFGLLFTAILLRLGESENYEFFYFQF